MNKFSLKYKYFRTAAGVRLCYSQTPKGMNENWLIFVHGMGGNASCWDVVRKKLYQKGYPSVAIDLRGYGGSDRLSDYKQYELPLFAKDVVELIDSLKIGKYVAIGHCFGGMVLMQAVEMGLKPRAMILMSTSYKPLAILQTGGLGKFLHGSLGRLANFLSMNHVGGHLDYGRFVGTGDYSGRRLYWDIRHSSQRVYLATFVALFKIDLTEVVRKLKMPVLLLAGNRDRVVLSKASKDMNEIMPNSELVIRSDWNHVPLLNQPDEVTEEFWRFCRQLK